MKQSWYSRLKERSRAWLLPVHIILAVWFFLFVGNLEAGFPAARVLMPAYMIIMLGPVAFLVINLPLSIYTAVKLRKGQTDGKNRTILIVFAALAVKLCWGEVVLMKESQLKEDLLFSTHLKRDGVKLSRCVA